MVALAAQRMTIAQSDRAPSLFAVRTSADPQVMLRVAGLFAQRDLVPEQICCRRVGEYLLIDIEIVLENDQTAQILLQKIRSLVHVERASLVGAIGF